MNIVDRFVSFVNPIAGVRRRAARTALAYYEAAEPSRERRFQTARVGQNARVRKAAIPVRTQARHLVLNHDIARGALRTMVNNVAGSNGVGVDPQPRNLDGTVNTEYAKSLSEAWRDFCRRPDVTHRLTMGQLQRAAVRAWIRDGEVFGQFVEGFRPDIDHGTRVPLSIELFEADLVPIEYDDETQKIHQGIELNSWGRPVGLHVSKIEPWRTSTLYSSNSTKRVPWDRVMHLATIDHIGQLRGVSEFASVINRLEDIKDYEESERVAAKIAAMLTAYVKKGNPETYEGNANGDPREIAFAPGMVIDDLMPGEDINTIDSKRPNPNLVTFRQGQLRAVAAGLGGSYSSFSKDYNGTYSAQRQELVEQWVNYAVLVDNLVSSMVGPIYRRFVYLADLSGVVRMPSGLLPGTFDDSVFVAQSMPWIDPLKEALGYEALVKAGFASEIEVIMKRGLNPRDVLEKIHLWREECKKKDLVFSSNEAALEAAKAAVIGDAA